MLGWRDFCAYGVVQCVVLLLSGALGGSNLWSSNGNSTDCSWTWRGFLRSVEGLPTLSEPFAQVQGSDLHYGCLTKKDDRLVIVPKKNPEPRAHVSMSGDVVELWFLASDLCAMGHTTKDPAHLAAFLLDYLPQLQQERRARPLRVKLMTVYGNHCMIRKAGEGGNKRSGVFLGVLRGWFHAVTRTDSPIVQHLRNRHFVEFVTTAEHNDALVSDHAADVRIRLVSQELYVEEAANSAAACATSKAAVPVYLIKRAERWRWFRTAWQADLFRRSLVHHYLRHAPSVAEHSVRMPLQILILRRDEDRHFDEEKVHKLLSSQIPPDVAKVSLETFDNIRGARGRPPPPHAAQLATLRNTSILIAAHGAGLSSVAVMHPGSVVIELFPHNFRYYMYEELATLMGLKYIAVESPKVWPPRCCSGRGGDTTPTLKDGIPSIVNGVGARSCKKCDILVSATQWMSLLRTALAHVIGQLLPL